MRSRYYEFNTNGRIDVYIDTSIPVECLVFIKERTIVLNVDQLTSMTIKSLIDLVGDKANCLVEQKLNNIKNRLAL